MKCKCTKYHPLPACKDCSHAQASHEYVSFHGIEEYGQCSECGCQAFV